MQTGSVVISVKGHDAGSLYVVVGCGEDFFLVCNGKQKKLECPKRKNIKHLKDTGKIINLSMYNPLYDAHIRKELKSLKSCVDTFNYLKK